MIEKDKALVPADEGDASESLQRLMALEPNVVLEQASRAARELKGVVDRKPKRVIINKEQYLEYEDWQTVAQFFSTSVITRDAVPVEIDGVKGAKAEADVIHLPTGRKVSGATAYCMRDEDNWKEKPWFQIASMAQTRAGAKALRNRFSWVVVLAGYKATPVEELHGWEYSTEGKTEPKETRQPPKTEPAKAETKTPPAKTEQAKATPTPEELGYSSAVELEKLRMDFYKVARTTMNDKEARQYIMKLGYDNTKVIPKEKFIEITKNLENAIALPKEQEDLQ